MGKTLLLLLLLLLALLWFRELRSVRMEDAEGSPESLVWLLAMSRLAISARCVRVLVVEGWIVRREGGEED